MILPLYWLMILIGLVIPSATAPQIARTQVYFAPYQVEGVHATACYGQTYANLCRQAEVPEDTIVLFPSAWLNQQIVQRHIVRHEFEHLLRAHGDAPGSTFDEADVARATCRDEWLPGYCEERE